MISVDISWQGQSTSDQMYSRTHVWRFDGGAEIGASASPAIVPPPCSDPALIDPEEALIASVSSCHMLFYLSLAANAGYEVGQYHDAAEGMMLADADGRMSITHIKLRPRVSFVSDAPNDASDQVLHGLAHTKCFIANSLKAQITIEPLIVKD